jgi:hypothetical protein
VGLLRAALAGYQDTNSLDHLGGRAGSLGKKDVGGAGAVERCDRTGDDHGRESRVQSLGAPHELIAIHLGHVEVAEEKVKGAGDGLLNDLEGMTG